MSLIEPSSPSGADLPGQPGAGVPAPPSVPLGTLIFRTGLVSAEQLREALEEGKKTGRRLGEVLVERGWLTGRDLARILAEQCGLQAIELEPEDVDPQAAALVPAEAGERLGVVGVRFQDGVAVVAVSDPFDELALAELRGITGGRVHVVVSEPERIARARAALATADAAPSVVAAPVDEPEPGAGGPIEEFTEPPPVEPVATEEFSEPPPVEPVAPSDEGGDPAWPPREVVAAGAEAAETEVRIDPPSPDAPEAPEAPTWPPPPETSVVDAAAADVPPPAGAGEPSDESVLPTPEEPPAWPPPPEPPPPVAAEAEVEETPAWPPQVEASPVAQAPDVYEVSLEIDAEAPGAAPASEEASVSPFASEPSANGSEEPQDPSVEPEAAVYPVSVPDAGPDELSDSVEQPHEADRDGSPPRSGADDGAGSSLFVPAPAVGVGGAAVVFRLMTGETVEIARFDDTDVAFEHASELVRQVVLEEQSGWPRVQGRFLRPGAIVSIDVEPLGGDAFPAA